MNRWTRLVRHQWLDESDTRRIVPNDMAQRLAARITASEALHTGEVRLCVEAALPWPVVWPVVNTETLAHTVRERALDWFGRLRIWDTEHNNGVLIYLLLAEQAIEVVADRALMQHVAPEHWQALVLRLSTQLQRGSVEAGLGEALDQVTDLLCTHFPAPQHHMPRNELPDTVVRC